MNELDSKNIRTKLDLIKYYGINCTYDTAIPQFVFNQLDTGSLGVTIFHFIYCYTSDCRWGELVPLTVEGANRMNELNWEFKPIKAYIKENANE